MPLILGGLLVYLAAFSPGLGPVPWAVNAEIYSPQARLSKPHNGLEPCLNTFPSLPLPAPSVFLRRQQHQWHP